MFENLPNCVEPKLECYGVIAVPECSDLYFIKHQNGLFLFETRKMRVYNLQKVVNQVEGWSFSQLVQIAYDKISGQYTLLSVEGNKPNFSLKKYNVTDLINSFKLMRLEELERRRQMKWTIF